MNRLMTLLMMSGLVLTLQAQNLNVFKNDAGKYGVKDIYGKIIVEPQYDYALSYSEGLLAVKKGQKWGYINEKGEMVITPQFEFAQNFSNGRAIVRKNDKKSAIIDMDGNLVYPYKDVSLRPFSDGVSVLTTIEFFDELQVAGVVNRWGYEIVPPGKYKRISDFGGGYAVVEKEVDDTSELAVLYGPIHNYGLIHLSGIETLPIGTIYNNPFVQVSGVTKVKTINGNLYSQQDLDSITLSKAKSSDENYFKFLMFHANRENSEVYTDLGKMFYHGTGTEKDDAEAAKWIQKGADAGDPLGMYALFSLYHEGIGVRQDDSRAKFWLKKAVEKGAEGAKEEMTKLGW